MADSNTTVGDLEEFKSSLNQFFLIVNGMIVLFMQCGFAFLEVGSVRSKNSTNILIKNLLDVFIAGVCYWVVGYAFAFGEQANWFIGYSNFAAHQMPEEKYALFFFQYVFAATAATIVSGAVAERCHFVAYLIYSFFLTGFIYPVVTHWAWSAPGWLAVGREYTTYGGAKYTAQYKDFAGSGVVHVVGGTAALTAATLLGARIGRFEQGNVQPIRGHSVPLTALGGFILVFGFMAFNGGSQGSISEPGDGAAVALSVTNTVISGSISAVVTLILNRFIGNSRWSLLVTINGGLAGMVAICAGCDVYHPYAASTVGAIAAVAFKSWAWLVQKLKIDDPLDAVAVHLGGGIWGVLAVAILRRDDGIVYSWDKPSFMGLAWQLTGLGAIIGWTGGLCFLMFLVLRLVGFLRVSEEIEHKGLDIPKHGEPAYPLEAYGHGWMEDIVAARLAHGDMENPDQNLYPNQATDEYNMKQNGSTGLTNHGYEVEVMDKGSYETPETAMSRLPNSRYSRDLMNPSSLSSLENNTPM